MRDGHGSEEKVESLELRRGQILAQIALRSDKDSADLIENLMEIDSRIFFLKHQEAKEAL
jgi:hypothetical protein